MQDKYNEKLCDERHGNIDTHLKEVKITIRIILAISATSLLVGIVKNPNATNDTVSFFMKLFGMIKIFTGVGV